MRHNKMIKTVTVLLLSSIALFAGVKGPHYNDIRTMGMGNTTVAVTTDRTAVYHNPAGLNLIGDKIQYSIAPLSLSIDGKFGTILKFMAENGGELSNFESITSDLLEEVNSFDGDWVGLELLPEITIASKNLGFGIYSVWPVAVMVESGHTIPKLGLRGQRDLVFTWAVGIPLKKKNHHMGISVEYLQRTPVSETITKFSDTFIFMDKLTSIEALGIVGDLSSIKHGVSFDVGFMHEWGPLRLAYNVRDLLGVIGGEMVLPFELDLGFGFFVPNLDRVPALENVIIAFDINDLFGTEPTTGKYESFTKKLHMGFELDAKYVVARFGINQGYPTAGFGLRFGIFKADYVFFQEEMGYYAGQMPRKKHVVSLGVGFSTKRRKRITETDDFIAENEKDYMKELELEKIRRERREKAIEDARKGKNDESGIRETEEPADSSISNPKPLEDSKDTNTVKIEKDVSSSDNDTVNVPKPVVEESSEIKNNEINTEKEETSDPSIVTAEEKVDAPSVSGEDMNSESLDNDSSTEEKQNIEEVKVEEVKAEEDDGTGW